MAAESLQKQWEEIKRNQRKTVADLSKECKKRSIIQRGFSEQNLGDLIYDTEGKSPEIKKLIQAVFDGWTGSTKSVEQGRPESVAPDVAKFQDRADDLTLEQWKRRAIQLEERLNQILAICQAPISSAPSADYRVVTKVVTRATDPAPKPASE